jgi:hypothetical protein
MAGRSLQRSQQHPDLQVRDFRKIKPWITGGPPNLSVVEAVGAVSLERLTG